MRNLCKIKLMGFSQNMGNDFVKTSLSNTDSAKVFKESYFGFFIYTRWPRHK